MEASCRSPDPKTTSELLPYITLYTRLCYEYNVGHMGKQRKKQLLLHGPCLAAALGRVIGELGFHRRCGVQREGGAARASRLAARTPPTPPLAAAAAAVAPSRRRSMRGQRGRGRRPGGET